MGEPTITNAENSILDNLPHPLRAHAQYRLNAVSAALQSKIRYGTTISCQDDQCNAFKHAYFNALNAKAFGLNYATLLGNAREGWLSLSTVNCLTQGANYMDLMNNDKGY